MKKAILWILLALMLGIPCMAAEYEEVIQSQSDALGLGQLEDAGGPYLNGMTLQDANLDDGLQTIIDTGCAELRGVLRKALHSGTLLLTVVLLSGVAGSLMDGSGKPAGFPIASLAGALAVTAVAVSDVESLLGLGRRTLTDMTEFSNILFPAVTALTAATGAITGASARQVAAVMFADLLMNLMDKLLVPLIYAYLAASIAHAALGNDGLKRVAGLIRWAVNSILTAVLIAFIGYLTLSGVIAGQADAAAVKATKFALSSAIPVVGGILSDAAETVLAGTGILRGTVGVYGMLTVLALCIVPFLQLSAHYLTYKLTAALASTVADNPTAGLIDSIGAAFGLILGMTGAGAIFLLISLVSSLSVMNV